MDFINNFMTEMPEGVIKADHIFVAHFTSELLVPFVMKERFPDLTIVIHDHRQSLSCPKRWVLQ